MQSLWHKAWGLSPAKDIYADSKNSASAIIVFVQERYRGDCPQASICPLNGYVYAAPVIQRGKMSEKVTNMFV